MARALSLQPPFLITFHFFPLPRKPNRSCFLSDPERTLPSWLAPDELSQLLWKGHLNIGDSAEFFFPPFPPSFPWPGLQPLFHIPCPTVSSGEPGPLFPLPPTSHPPLPPASSLLSDDKPQLFSSGICLRLLAEDRSRSRGNQRAVRLRVPGRDLASHNVEGSI